MSPKEIVTRHYPDARSVRMAYAYEIVATVGRQQKQVGAGQTVRQAWFSARTRIRTASTDEYWFELISGRIDKR
jgi:hypothetical protein